VLTKHRGDDKTTTPTRTRREQTRRNTSNALSNYHRTNMTSTIHCLIFVIPLVLDDCSSALFIGEFCFCFLLLLCVSYPLFALNEYMKRLLSCHAFLLLLFRFHLSLSLVPMI
jgi:hypothetical protein